MEGEMKTLTMEGDMKNITMEGEMKTLAFVWTTALASLIYCHKISKLIAPGTTRLCAFIPVFCIFLYLPLLFTSIHTSGVTSFFLTWLATFKLLLFAFQKGPLLSNPPLPLSKFILTACLPIKISSQNGNKSTQFTNKNSSATDESQANEASKKGKKSLMNYSVKFLVYLFLLNMFGYGDQIHPHIKMGLLCVYIYLSLDVGLAMVAYLAKAAVGFDLEPHFDDPYLATSLQDFWGKRWNLMVTSILHPTVYLPVRSISGRFLSKELASLPAVMATFIVSGLMHELIFYYLGRMKPTWEVTWFFVIHGVLVGVELVVKRAVGGRFRLPAVVSGGLALGLVITTSFWLFIPPLLRCGYENPNTLLAPASGFKLNDVSCSYF